MECSLSFSEPKLLCSHEALCPLNCTCALIQANFLLCLIWHTIHHSPSIENHCSSKLKVTTIRLHPQASMSPKKLASFNKQTSFAQVIHGRVCCIHGHQGSRHHFPFPEIIQGLYLICLHSPAHWQESCMSPGQENHVSWCFAAETTDVTALCWHSMSLHLLKDISEPWINTAYFCESFNQGGTVRDNTRLDMHFCVNVKIKPQCP